MTRDTESLLSGLRTRLPSPLPPRLGVAISGGSDSTALLHLLARVAGDEGIRLFAATVDHGLRPEAGDEAARVAALCEQMNIPHTILEWRDWDGSGNLQDQARRARYQLLRGWAAERGIAAIALGHTADDQAETVLMRLARAAGVTGLSAMPVMRDMGGVALYRPLLFATRADLRAYLDKEGVGWAEDPSNQDRRYDRIKARQALAGLSELGITAESLTRVAENMAQADQALQRYAREMAQSLCAQHAGSIQLDRAGFAAAPPEIQRRLVVGFVGWIAGGGYPPRQATVARAVTAIAAGQTAVIGGCQIVPSGKFAWICRELNAVSWQVARPGEFWDGRWILRGPDADGAEVRALGEAGLKQLSDWRALGLPRVALTSTPAVWRGDHLLSAPLAGLANGWMAEIVPARAQVWAAFLSH